MTNEMVLERKSNLVMPSHYVELDRDEMSYVEGGGRIKVTISASIGSTLGGVVASSVTSFLSGYLAAKFAKCCGVGGIIGAVIGLLVGTAVGIGVSYIINSVFGSGISYTLIDKKSIFNFNLDIDLTDLFKTIASIGGGGLGGYAAGFALGAVS